MLSPQMLTGCCVLWAGVLQALSAVLVTLNMLLHTCAHLVEQSSVCCNVLPPLVQGFEACTVLRYAVTLQNLVMCKLQGCLLASLCFVGNAVLGSVPY